MKKNIRYYTYAALILICAGLYVYGLSPRVPYGAAIKDKLYSYSTYLPFLILIIYCFINIILAIINRGKYFQFTDEEKKLYSISKVKVATIFFFLFVTVVTAFEIVFWAIYPHLISPMILIGCFLIEIVIVVIFEHTKWIFHWFCKKSNSESKEFE